MEIMSEGTREQVPATPTGGLHIVNYWKSTHICAFKASEFSELGFKVADEFSIDFL